MIVSRETRERLDIFVAELKRWQPAVNLVSPATLAEVWTRHVEDCWQLAEVEPDAMTWLDVGSGAGLPGLVIAASERLPYVTMVERDRRKCAFLRHASHRMAVAARILEGRVEEVEPAGGIAVVTARGLAPLTRLLQLTHPVMLEGAVGLFPKGRSFAAELTEARESWTFTADVLPSRTDSESRILRISEVRRKTRPGEHPQP